jgi:hypothetical protein
MSTRVFATQSAAAACGALAPQLGIGTWHSQDFVVGVRLELVRRVSQRCSPGTADPARCRPTRTIRRILGNDCAPCARSTRSCKWPTLCRR